MAVLVVTDIILLVLLVQAVVGQAVIQALAVLAVMPLATLPPAVQVEAEVLLQAAGMQDRMGQTAPPPLPSDKV